MAISEFFQSWPKTIGQDSADTSSTDTPPAPANSVVTTWAQTDDNEPEPETQVTASIMDPEGFFSANSANTPIDLSTPRAQEPPMSGGEAVDIVADNWETVRVAAGDDDDTAGTEELTAIAQQTDADPELRAAAQYLLDNPEMYQMMEIMNDGDRLVNYPTGYDEADDKFNQQDLIIFGQGQDHLRTIYENADLVDVANKGGEGDGDLSRADFEAITEDETASDELREAAQFFLDNDRFYEAVDSAISHGTAPEIGVNGGNSSRPDGTISIRDLQLSAIQSQAYTDDPAAAHEFIMGGNARIEGTDVSDENSVPDEGMRALVRSALQETDNVGDVIDLTLELPETNGGLRNELITATYAELGVGMDELLGDESGANWAVWGVPASANVGDVIRNEPVIEVLFANNGATGAQRTLMAEGNLLLFAELAPALNEFVETFGSDLQPDQAKLDEFLDQLDPDQQHLAAGFQNYYDARFESDTQAKQELTLAGNYELVIHEQTLIDPTLDRVLTDLPWYADGFNFVSGNLGSDRANAAIRVEYPGRSTSVENDVPAHDPDQAAYANRLVNFDDIENEDVRDTLTQAQAAGGGDSTDPDSLESTYADDWHELDERMYYIYQDWRLHHTDSGLFEMADSSGYDSLGVFQ